MPKNFNKKKNLIEPRINNEITGQNEVRLIYKEHKDSVSENDFNKVVSWEEAIRLSRKLGLDLIEINSKSTPIVVRLEDYSKYLYNLKKQLKQQKQKTAALKEIQLSVNISSHDLDIKIKKAKEVIEDGGKVKVVLQMKGRELSRREISKKCFYIFIENMLESGIASLESAPRDEEKKCYVIFKHK